MVEEFDKKDGVYKESKKKTRRIDATKFDEYKFTELTVQYKIKTIKISFCFRKRRRID